MAIPVYHPFERFIFNDRTCFISGETIENSEKISVFPQWILQDFGLDDQPFKLLDESIITYGEITVPCSSNSLIAIAKLENVISEAFAEGYPSVKQVSNELLFQWISKLVYGIIYYEMRTGIRQQALTGERINFSQSLAHKFGNFHLMLQAIIKPVVFEGVVPWSVLVFPVNNLPDTFSYRDEINTLTFSLRMKDFGIIACLQDNGENKIYHQDILQKAAGQILHPIQFEELAARFFYSSYLFNRLPEYTILHAPQSIYVEAMPLRGNKALFDSWQVKTYGQVLENFWKAWGFPLFEIIKNPEWPMSFLTAEDGGFKPYETINLPA